MFILYLLGVRPPCRWIFCQFWLCEQAQCVYLRRHLGSPENFLLTLFEAMKDESSQKPEMEPLGWNRVRLGRQQRAGMWADAQKQTRLGPEVGTHTEGPG